MAKKNVVSKLSLENIVREIKAWFKKIGLTQAEADKRYLQLSGGKMTNGFEIATKTGRILIFPSSVAFENSDATGESGLGFGYLWWINYEYNDWQGISLSAEFGIGRDHPDQEEMPYFAFTEDMGLFDGVLVRGVLAPISDLDAANKKYVDDSISAQIGNINAILDSINGEVV